MLVVTNGKQTERQYLMQLKKLVDHTRIVVNIVFVHGEPSTMIKHLCAPKGDTGGYDEVWIVVDEDGHDRTPLYRECMKLSTSRQKWYAVVSRPSFEVWLIAHYGPVRNYQSQKDASRHYCLQAGLQAGAKDVPADFPMDRYTDATSRCRLPAADMEELNELPPSPGSGMPHLLRALGIV